MTKVDRALPAAPLTEHERRVALAVGSGLSNKAVARDFVVSIKTVEFHLGNVYRKLGIASRAELALLVGSRSSLLFGTEVDSIADGSLPPPASLIGRAEDLETVNALVIANPLVTLTGVGGVGKTTLALAVANEVSSEFPDGVWWVDLAPLARDRDVASVVASVLKVNESPGGRSASALAAALRGTRLLVVLDNCEHVLESAGALCAELLRSCPRLAVLATSRHRLGVARERTVAVNPLDVEGPDSPALALLIERIDRLGESRDAAEAMALEDICRHLDGLPLALELAAGRCRTMAATEVAARLRDRFRLLGGRSGEGRSTLNGTVKWSFDLLTPEAQTVFIRISAFAGSFPLIAAERLAATDALDQDMVDDALAELVELSLVDFANDRYRLLETTRAFGRELLATRGETETVLDAHLELIVDLVTDARLGVRGADEARWVRQLDLAWPDIRAAFHRSLERDEPTAAIHLATHLAWEAFYRRPEACTWIDEANRRFETVAHPHRHELVGAAAFAAWVLGEPARALKLGQEAMALDPSPGTAVDRLPEWATVNALGWTGEAQSGIDLAWNTIATLADEPFLLAFWLSTMPIAYSFVGDLQSGRDPSARALEMANGLKNPSLLAYSSIGACIAHLESDPEQAIDILRHGKSLALSVGNSWLEYSLTGLGLSISTSVPGHDSGTDLQRSIELARIWSRRGWNLHAWAELSTIARLLLEEKRSHDAAVVLHAYLNSPAALCDPLTTRHVAQHLIEAIGADEMAKLRQESLHFDLQSLIELASTSATT